MSIQVTLEQAAAALRTMYGERMENGYEDGKDAMTETLQESFKLSKHEARTLVNDLEKARTIRWQGEASSLPASQNQGTNIPLVDGFWYL